MKILIVAAHPDDIDLFMGGTLCKILDNNMEVYCVIVTDGSLSPKNNSPEKNSKLRKIETKKSLIGTKIIFLDIKDGTVRDNYKNIKLLNKIFNQIHPDIIFTHNINDYHSDHCEIAKIMKFIVSFKIPFIMFDVIYSNDSKPNFYIDITNYIKRKINMIKIHKTQRHLELEKQAIIVNNYRGFEYFGDINKYAESFFIGNKYPLGKIFPIINFN